MYSMVELYWQKNWSLQRKTHPSATFSTTDPTQTGQTVKLDCSDELFGHSTALNELLTQQNTITEGYVTSSDK